MSDVFHYTNVQDYYITFNIQLFFIIVSAYTRAREDKKKTTTEKTYSLVLFFFFSFIGSLFLFLSVSVEFCYWNKFLACILNILHTSYDPQRAWWWCNSKRFAYFSLTFRLLTFIKLSVFVSAATQTTSKKRIHTHTVHKSLWKTNIWTIWARLFTVCCMGSCSFLTTCTVCRLNAFLPLPLFQFHLKLFNSISLSFFHILLFLSLIPSYIFYLYAFHLYTFVPLFKIRV